MDYQDYHNLSVSWNNFIRRIFRILAAVSVSVSCLVMADSVYVILVDQHVVIFYRKHSFVTMA